jgi:tRNA threonylcarbamoyladenosine biosynthesis protein TsaB
MYWGSRIYSLRVRLVPREHRVQIDDKYILALETSSRQGSVAVGRGSVLLGQVDFTAGARHGVELVPAVDRLMRQADLRPDQIAIACVSAGPGSFTGLRVGFTFARCLSEVTGAKLVAVPSTDVVAENVRESLQMQANPVYLAPILDAKRKQVYTAGFRWQDGRLDKILPECVRSPADLLKALGRPAWITGEGIDYHREAFTGHQDVVLLDREFWIARAQNVLRLGAALAREDKFTPYNHLVPTYVRLPEAEERWQLRQTASS